MLFGRKTLPTATPKPEDAPAVQDAPPAAPEAAAGEPAVPASPLTSPPTGAQPAPFGATSSAVPLRPPFSDKGPEMNTTPPKPPAGPSPASFKPSDIPRRTVDVPGMTPRKPDGYAIPGATPAPIPAPVAAPAPPPAPAPIVEQRRLIVGRDISLSGEIGSCDVLVVEGTVEAKLRDGRSIEITENGLFKGSVEIDEADIGGRFEGDLIVRGRLMVRSTGKITGSIKYGELSVEAGGQLVGDIQVHSAAASKPVLVATPVAAPMPLSVPSFASADAE
ncbi:bactofilin family protein [Azospirillum sp. sgz301742]